MMKGTNYDQFEAVITESDWMNQGKPWKLQDIQFILMETSWKRLHCVTIVLSCSFS